MGQTPRKVPRIVVSDADIDPPAPGAVVVSDADIDAPATLAATGPAAPAQGWADTALEWLPTAGGVAGGIVGGIGGTVGGVGVGGVPGAISGATLGGAFGESARQLINRARGAQAPATPAEAATAIGVQGAIQGAGEATGAALGRHGRQSLAVADESCPQSHR